MLTQAEKTAQVDRMRSLIREADTKVWSQKDYPQAHRPEVAVLLPKLQIGIFPAQSYTTHPQIKPEWLVEGTSLTNDLHLEDAIKQMAWYDETTRRIFVSEGMLSLPNASLRRILYHEFATDLCGRMEILSPIQYSPIQRQLVEENLDFLFADNYRPSLETTHISKAGFKEIAMVGEYSIGLLVSPAIDNVDEIYPTMVEIITDQILRRDGNVSAFDRDAKKGTVLVLNEDDHPQFAETTFNFMKYLDWRNLLNAFKTGDLQQTLDYIARYAGDRSEMVIASLSAAMERDEQLIASVNSFAVANNLYH